MFKKTEPSTRSNTQFGLGSVIVGAANEKYVVVMESLSSVKLLNLSTFEPLIASAVVRDLNYMTEEETRSLVNVSLSGAFSDYTFDPAGLKNSQFRY